MAPSAPPPAPIREPERGPVGVLVVDDEEPIRNALRRFLTQEKYDVHTAATGAEGLDIAGIATDRLRAARPPAARRARHRPGAAVPRPGSRPRDPGADRGERRRHRLALPAAGGARLPGEAGRPGRPAARGAAGAPPARRAARDPAPQQPPPRGSGAADRGAAAGAGRPAAALGGHARGPGERARGQGPAPARAFGAGRRSRHQGRGGARTARGHGGRGPDRGPAP